MERRAALAALALLSGAASAEAAQFPEGTPREFLVHSGCSGWTIVRNSATDYSVRMLGENPAQSLKLIRLTGPDAFAQAQDIYQMVTFLTGVLGVTRPGL